MYLIIFKKSRFSIIRLFDDHYEIAILFGVMFSRIADTVHQTSHKKFTFLDDLLSEKIAFIINNTLLGKTNIYIFFIGSFLQ